MLPLFLFQNKQKNCAENNIKQSLSYKDSNMFVPKNNTKQSLGYQDFNMLALTPKI